MAKMSSFEIPFNELQKCADQGSYIMEEIYKRGGNVKASWTMEPGIPSSNVKINFELLPGPHPTIGPDPARCRPRPLSANERITALIGRLVATSSERLEGYCPPQKYRESINCEKTSCSKCKQMYLTSYRKELESEFIFKPGELLS